MRSIPAFVLLMLSFCVYSQSDSSNKLVDSSDIFYSVQVMPEFIWGKKAMFKFIEENLVYPERAKEKGIEGTVYIKFVVEKDGSLNYITLLNKDTLGYGCEQEAINVVKKMPKWRPGIQDAIKMRIYFTIPITFKLKE